MRTLFLAVIFLLILTLGNALLYRRDTSAQTLVHAPSIAPAPVAADDGRAWQWFAWRELAALTLTVAVFGRIAHHRRP